MVQPALLLLPGNVVLPLMSEVSRAYSRRPYHTLRVSSDGLSPGTERKTNNISRSIVYSLSIWIFSGVLLKGLLKNYYKSVLNSQDLF